MKKKEENKLEIIKNREAQPFQLELFELKVGNERHYSNTIEFWDIIPKYFYGRVKRKEVVDEKAKSVMHTLPPLLRKIKYGKHDEAGKKEMVNYNISINPAILTKKDKKTGNNISTYHYPSTREELVEDVLKKFIAIGKGGFIEDDISTYFSLREIEEELKKCGHSYSKTEIKEALQIMNKAHIEIVSDRGVAECGNTIITNLVIAGRGKGETKCYCSLNSLVSSSIKRLRFRKYDYTKCMLYNIPLSRYIYKRISHYYKQIDKETPYVIKVSTLLNDSGYYIQENTTKRFKKVKSALDELKEKDAIVSYELEPIKQKQVKLKVVDYKIYIIPSEKLISDIIGANKKQKHNRLVEQVQKNKLL